MNSLLCNESNFRTLSPALRQEIANAIVACEVQGGEAIAFILGRSYLVKREWHGDRNVIRLEEINEFSNHTLGERFVISIPDGGAGSEYIFSEIKVDIEKLRRRVRDALNKTADEREIIRCAHILGVKLD